MASGGKEHRMVFDIRGRRKYAVKVVYAVLALLMGVSLFLVVGPVNLGQLLGTSGGTGNPAAQYEEQAETIERKLKAEPEEPNLLLNLTRTRINAANQLYEGGLEEERTATPEALQQLQLASDSWSKYLKATKEPTAGAAQLVAPNLIVLAQYSRTFPEAQANLEAASEAQQLIVDKRRNLNSLSVLSYYTALTGEYDKAKKIGQEAKPFAATKFARENIDNEVKKYVESGEKFQTARKKGEKEESAASEASAGTETPGSSLGGTGVEGGASLGE
jgi:hypothetical protein